VNLAVQLDLLREIPEDESLRRQWNALVKRVHRPQVFYTYEWSLAVQRAYGATLQPLLFLARDDKGALCGVAALASDSARKVSFLCATTGDYCDILSLPEQKPTIVAAISAELNRQCLGEITLTNLPADSDTVAALEQASGHGYYRFVRTAYECAQVSLPNVERRPGENMLLLPRRKMLRRSLSAMSRDGPVRLDHARSWEQIEPILPQFMQAHVARFLYTGRISNMAHPERRVFLEQLARLLSQSGWLTLTRMVSGNRTLAWNYGFQFEGTWFWYQPSFDSDLEKYSPGFCLLAKIIEEAADDPALKVVDLGLGAEEYKDRFANQVRGTLQVTLAPSAIQPAREVLRYRAAEIAKRSPRLEAGLRFASSFLSRNGIAGGFSQIRKRMKASLWLETEVSFLEWTGSAEPDPASTKLEPLDTNHLASATCQYVDDSETLAYLLRSASRLRNGAARGFGLVAEDGIFLNFVWVSDFDRFFVLELNAKVEAPSSECALLFDCWTPDAVRGHEHHVRALSLVAKRIKEEGKRPWICCTAAGDVFSLQDLERAGFQQRYSLKRQRLLGWQWIKGAIPPPADARAAEVSARI